jgi:hypothetical protein
MKYWEIIAARLSAEGWSWGYTSFVDSTAQTVFSVDAHREGRGRHIVRSDEMLTAFLELEKLLSAAWRKV